MRYCCKVMKICVEKLKHVEYIERFDEFALPVGEDLGRSVIILKYCPWCGKKLPESKRQKWFEILNELGIDPTEDKLIPYPLKRSLWWEDLGTTMDMVKEDIKE